ncbi:glycosyltransferase [Paenibacillus sp. 1001270B_150601_E10]|uniref:glycosyltransferase n=1 Tax=Paenibacillus sp. 1001270B_150601_E10 TaxID=2787079 RepID=UPI0018A074EA|nr:glycosyltransferase [Paenibacillus sp. 1001270B_150601_E10]
MPKISIVVPVFNSEHYLKRCVDSILNQSLTDIEIILVNDASTDRSIDILKDYERRYPDNVIVIDSEINLKQGGARNLGMKVATGEYIGFVDSDDWIASDMYEQLYLTAKQNNADIVSCNCYRAISENKYFPFLWRDLSSITGKLDYRKKETILIEGASAAICSKIYKKSLIIDNKLWFPEHLFYEDNLWVPMVFLYAKNYYHLNEAYYYYFFNSNSTVVSTESMHHFDRLTIEEMKLEEFRSRDLYDQFRDAIEFSFINLYYVNSLHLVFTRFKKPPFIKAFEIRKYMKDHYPQYRTNKYFDKISDTGRILTGLNDISPYRAYEWYKNLLNTNGN